VVLVRFVTVACDGIIVTKIKAMAISKFLIHWIGQDLQEQRALKDGPLDDWEVGEYAKRLKDDYQHGLFTRRQKEKDVLPGIAIANLVRICFTEVRLSQAQSHAERYG
jgi:hypothetical protein